MLNQEYPRRRVVMGDMLHMSAPRAHHLMYQPVQRHLPSRLSSLRVAEAREISTVVRAEEVEVVLGTVVVVVVVIMVVVTEETVGIPAMVREARGAGVLELAERVVVGVVSLRAVGLVVPGLPGMEPRTGTVAQETARLAEPVESAEPILLVEAAEARAVRVAAEPQVRAVDSRFNLVVAAEARVLSIFHPQ